MESSAALPHAARELLLKGGGCAVNFECAPELCAPLRAELARSGRSGVRRASSSPMAASAASAMPRVPAIRSNRRR